MEDTSISQKIEKDIAEFKERYLKSLGVDTSKSGAATSKRRNSTSSSKRADISDATVDHGGSQLSNQTSSKRSHIISNRSLPRAVTGDVESPVAQVTGETSDPSRSPWAHKSKSCSASESGFDRDSNQHSDDTKKAKTGCSWSACSLPSFKHSSSSLSTSSSISLQTSNYSPTPIPSSPSSSSTSLISCKTSQLHSAIKTHQDLSNKSAISLVDRQKIKEEYIQSLRLSRRSSVDQNVFPDLKKRLTEFEKTGASTAGSEPVEFVTSYTKTHKDLAASCKSEIRNYEQLSNISKDPTKNNVPIVSSQNPPYSSTHANDVNEKRPYDRKSDVSDKYPVISNDKELSLLKEQEKHSISESHRKSHTVDPLSDKEHSPLQDGRRDQDETDALAKRRQRFRRIQSCDFTKTLDSLEIKHRDILHNVPDDKDVEIPNPQTPKPKMLLRTQSFDEGQGSAKTFYEKITPVKHVIQLPGVEPLKSKVEKFNTRYDSKTAKKMVYSDRERGVVSDAIRKAGSSYLHKQEDKVREKRQSKIPLIQKDKISSIVSRFEVIKEKPGSSSFRKQETNTREEEIMKVRKSNTVRRVSQTLSSRLTSATLSKDSMPATQKSHKSEERIELTSSASQVKPPVPDKSELASNQNRHSLKCATKSNEDSNISDKLERAEVKNESEIEEHYLYYIIPSTKSENTSAVGERVRDGVTESASNDDAWRTSRSLATINEWKLVFDEDEKVDDISDILGDASCDGSGVGGADGGIGSVGGGGGGGIGGDVGGADGGGGDGGGIGGGGGDDGGIGGGGGGGGDGGGCDGGGGDTDTAIDLRFQRQRDYSWCCANERISEKYNDNMNGDSNNDLRGETLRDVSVDDNDNANDSVDGDIGVDQTNIEKRKNKREYECGDIYTQDGGGNSSDGTLNDTGLKIIDTSGKGCGSDYLHYLPAITNAVSNREELSGNSDLPDGRDRDSNSPGEKDLFRSGDDGRNILDGDNGCHVTSGESGSVYDTTDTSKEIGNGGEGMFEDRILTSTSQAKELAFTRELSSQAKELSLTREVSGTNLHQDNGEKDKVEFRDNDECELYSVEICIKKGEKGVTILQMFDEDGVEDVSVDQNERESESKTKRGELMHALEERKNDDHISLVQSNDEAKREDVINEIENELSVEMAVGSQIVIQSIREAQSQIYKRDCNEQDEDEFSSGVSLEPASDPDYKTKCEDFNIQTDRAYLSQMGADEGGYIIINADQEIGDNAPEILEPIRTVDKNGSQTGTDSTDQDGFHHDKILPEDLIDGTNEASVGKTVTVTSDEHKVNKDNFDGEKCIEEVWPKRGKEHDKDNDKKVVGTHSAEMDREYDITNKDVEISDVTQSVRHSIFDENNEQNQFLLIDREKTDWSSNNSEEVLEQLNKPSELSELCEHPIETPLDVSILGKINDDDDDRKSLSSIPSGVVDTLTSVDFVKKENKIKGEDSGDVDVTKNLPCCSPKDVHTQQSGLYGLQNTHDVTSNRPSTHTAVDLAILTQIIPSPPHFNNSTSDGLRFEPEVGDIGVMSSTLEGYENMASLPPANHDRDESSSSTLQLISDTADGQGDRSPSATPCSVAATVSSSQGEEEGSLEPAPVLINTFPDCEHSFINVTLNSSNPDGRGERRNSTVVVGRCFFDEDCCVGQLEGQVVDGGVGDGQTFRDNVTTCEENVSDKEFDFSEICESGRLSFEENCVIVSHFDDDPNSDHLSTEGDSTDVLSLPQVVLKSVAGGDSSNNELLDLIEDEIEWVESGRCFSFESVCVDKLSQCPERRDDVLKEEPLIVDRGRFPDRECSSYCEDSIESENDSTHGTQSQSDIAIHQPGENELPFELNTSLCQSTHTDFLAPTECLNVNTWSRETSVSPSDISDNAESFHSGLCDSFESFLSAEDSPQGFDRSPWCTDTLVKPYSKSSPPNVKTSEVNEHDDNGEFVFLETYDYPADWSKISDNHLDKENANVIQENINSEAISIASFSEAKEDFNLSTGDSLIYLDTNLPNTVTRNSDPQSPDQKTEVNDNDRETTKQCEKRSKYKLRLPNSIDLFKSKLNPNWLSHLPNDLIWKQDASRADEVDCNANPQSCRDQNSFTDNDEVVAFQFPVDKNQTVSSSTMTTLLQEYLVPKESQVEQGITFDIQGNDGMQTWRHISSAEFDSNGNFFTADSRVVDSDSTRDKMNQNVPMMHHEGLMPPSDLTKGLGTHVRECNESGKDFVCNFVHESKVDHYGVLDGGYSTSTVPRLALLARNAAKYIIGSENINSGTAPPGKSNVNDFISQDISKTICGEDNDNETKENNFLNEETPKEPPKLSLPSPTLVRKGMYELKTFTVKVLEQKDIFVPPKQTTDKKDIISIGNIAQQESESEDDETKPENIETDSESINDELSTQECNPTVPSDNEDISVQHDAAECGDEETDLEENENYADSNARTDIDTNGSDNGVFFNEECKKAEESTPSRFLCANDEFGIDNESAELNQCVEVDYNNMTADDDCTKQSYVKEPKPIEIDLDGVGDDIGDGNVNDDNHAEMLKDNSVTDKDVDNRNDDRIIEGNKVSSTDEDDCKYDDGDEEDGASVGGSKGDSCVEEEKKAEDWDSVFAFGLFDELVVVSDEVDAESVEGNDGVEGLEYKHNCSVVVAEDVSFVKDCDDQDEKMREKMSFERLENSEEKDEGEVDHRKYAEEQPQRDDHKEETEEQNDEERIDEGALRSDHYQNSASGSEEYDDDVDNVDECDDDDDDEFYMIQPDSLNSIAGCVDSPPCGSSRENLSDFFSQEWNSPISYKKAVEYSGHLDDDGAIYNDANENFEDANEDRLDEYEYEDDDKSEAWEEVVENIFNIEHLSLLPELDLYPIQEDDEDVDDTSDDEWTENLTYDSEDVEVVLDKKKEDGDDYENDVSSSGFDVSLEEDTVVSACKKIVTWSDGFPDRRVNLNFDVNENNDELVDSSSDDSRVVRRVKIRESCIWDDFGVGGAAVCHDDDYKRRSCSMEADSLDGYEEDVDYRSKTEATRYVTLEHNETDHLETNSKPSKESHSSSTIIDTPYLAPQNNSTQSSSLQQELASNSSENYNNDKQDHSSSEHSNSCHQSSESVDDNNSNNLQLQSNSSLEDVASTGISSITNDNPHHPTPSSITSEAGTNSNHHNDEQDSENSSKSDSTTSKSSPENETCQKKVRLSLHTVIEDSDKEEDNFNDEEEDNEDDSDSRSSHSLSDSSSFEGRIDHLTSPISPLSPSGFRAFNFRENCDDTFSSSTEKSNMSAHIESGNSILVNGDALASASQNSFENTNMDSTVNPLRLDATNDAETVKTEEEEAEVDVFLESPNSGLHRIHSENIFQPNKSMDNTTKSEDLYKKLERSQSDASLLNRDMERLTEETEVHLTAAENSSGQNISECNRVYLDLSKAEAFEKVELGENGAMMRTSSGRLLETIPQDEELKTGDLSYIYASHRSFSTESSSSMEDLNSYGKTKSKEMGANKYKNTNKAIPDGGNTNIASKSNLRSSFQIYSHSLKQKVRQLQMGSLPEQVNALKELNVLMEQAWSMPVYGKDLAYELCDILRTESALDIIVGNVASNNRELMKVSARLLEQSLTTYNRRQVAETGLEMVVKMTHDCIGDCELAQIVTGILESLFKTSEETCSRVIKLGGLDVITFWCRCNDRVTLKNCAIALSNLALYGGRENQQEMTKHKVPEWLFPLAFVEDDSVRYYALLAIGILVSNKEIENDVVSSGTLALVLPFVDSHDPAEFAQRDTSHRHGRSPGWLKRLIPVLSSKREEAQSLAAFHFVMEAGIKSEQDRKEVLYKIGAVEPLKWLASTPNRVASRLAGQALRIIGEEIPHKLSQQVPLWTIDDVVHWIAQVGFSGFTDVFQACQVDGDLLLRLSEDDLKESLEMPCAVTRKRFQRELRDLKMSADYTSCDPSMLGSWLRNVSEDMAQYTYQMLHAGMDRPLLRSVTNQHLMQDCGVTNGIHRMKIIAKIDEFRSNPVSPTPPTLDRTEAPSKPPRNPKQSIDVFISYRRSNGSQLASLLKVHLQLRGFTVFIDIERLRAGKFDENLLESVNQAKNFIIVLTQNSLDRCMGDDNKKDWVHREITAAMEAGINIIPLMDNFRWPTPDSLPEDMRNLVYFNGIRWIHDYQDACVDKLESFIRGESSFNREPTPVNGNFGASDSCSATTTTRISPLMKENTDVTDISRDGPFSSSYSAPTFTASSSTSSSEAPFPSSNTKGSFQSANSPPYQRAQGLHKDCSIDIDSPPGSS